MYPDSRELEVQRMKKRFGGLGRLVIAAALLAGAPAELPAQQAANLPAARELVSRYVAAIGGREAVLRPASSRAVGHFEMPAAGLRGDMEILSARPNRMVSIITIPGLGVIRSGFDGTVGWSVDPMMGARLMSGAELDATRDQSNMLAAVRDPSLFRSMETVERTEIGGQPCHKVKLVWTSGRESFDCYHTETGLLVATIATQESPMGSVEVTTSYSDYREFGGVRMPTRMTQAVMGQQQILSVTDVQYDAVDASAFELPAEIRALVGR